MPNNATPVDVKFEANAKLGTITTEGGSANVTLGANNTATAIILGGTNDTLTLDGTGNYADITSIVGAETIDGGTGAGATVSLSALPKDANNKLVKFDLKNTLQVVTAEGVQTVDASNIRDISTALIINAENASGNLTFIGSTTHVSGGQVTDVKTPFVSVNVKDAIISENTKDLKTVNILASGNATVNEAQIKTGGNLAATTFAGSGSLTVNADGKDAVNLGTANFTVANATIAATNDVTAAITGLTGTGNTTLELAANKGITASGSLTDIDTIKLNGTNKIDAGVLNTFAAASGALTTTANTDKVLTDVGTGVTLKLGGLTGATVDAVLKTATSKVDASGDGAAALYDGNLNILLGDSTTSKEGITFGSTAFVANKTATTKLYANTTEKISIDSDNSVLGPSALKINLEKVGANIEFTKAASGDLTLTDLIDNASASGDDTVKASVTALSSGQTATIVLTNANDVIDISAAAASSTGALTLTATNFAKADKFVMADAAAVASTNGKVTFQTAIQIDIKGVTITNGVATFDVTSGQESKLTVENILTALNTAKSDASGNPAVVGANKAVIATTNDGKAYLFYTGASTDVTTDDVAVLLGTASELNLTSLAIDANHIATIA